MPFIVTTLTPEGDIMYIKLWRAIRDGFDSWWTEDKNEAHQFGSREGAEMLLIEDTDTIEEVEP